MYEIKYWCSVTIKLFFISFDLFAMSSMVCQKNFGPPKILVLDQHFHINFGPGPKFFKKFSPTWTNIFKKIGPGFKKLVCPAFSAAFTFYCNFMHNHELFIISRTIY